MPFLQISSNNVLHYINESLQPINKGALAFIQRIDSFFIKITYLIVRKEIKQPICG